MSKRVMRDLQQHMKKLTFFINCRLEICLNSMDTLNCILMHNNCILFLIFFEAIFSKHTLMITCVLGNNPFGAKAKENLC